jgi:hypothetical protein
MDFKCKTCGFIAFGVDPSVAERSICLNCRNLMNIDDNAMVDDVALSLDTEAPLSSSISSGVTESRFKKIINNIKSILTLETYKCLVLTIIAATLIGIYLKTPVPFTKNNLVSKKVAVLDVPLVRIQGGSVDVVNTVDIDGRVQVENTVEVEGDVRITR